MGDIISIRYFLLFIEKSFLAIKRLRVMWGARTCELNLFLVLIFDPVFFFV